MTPMDTRKAQPLHEPQPSGPDRRISVLAINGSPHRDKGNTALILNPFLEGMKEAGAEVEVVYTEDLTIHPCRGDLVCMCRASGRCVQADDMDQVLPRVRGADIIVFASPLYVDGVTGPLKMLIDRLVPLVRIAIETRDGHCRHVPRDTKVRKIVLVSNCGFFEKDNFNPLIMHMQALSLNLNAGFAGALLRPHGPALRGMLEKGAPVQDIPDAAREAGRMLVTRGTIPEDLLATVSRPLLPREMYLRIANQSTAEMLEKAELAPAVPECRKGLL